MPFPADPSADRLLAAGFITDQDPNHQSIYEVILTARLAYVSRVIQAGCAYMGLGPAGLTPVDGPIL
eukprot:6736895-Alexandrium_andersonii.AAC.1